MKKYLLLSVCVMLLTQACKKENDAPVVTPVKSIPGDGVIVVPEPPAGTAPVHGEPVTDEPVSANIEYRKLNARLGYNKPVFLDVDGDGTVDFTFSSVLLMEGSRPYLYLYATAKTGSGNKLLVQQGPDLVINALYTHALNKDESIGATMAGNVQWTGISQKGFILGISETTTDKQQLGHWINKTDKYMGIQLKIAGQIHYGWVQLSHDNTKDEIILSGFAYLKTSGTIAAGHK